MDTVLAAQIKYKDCTTNFQASWKFWAYVVGMWAITTLERKQMMLWKAGSLCDKSVLVLGVQQGLALMNNVEGIQEDKSSLSCSFPHVHKGASTPAHAFTLICKCTHTMYTHCTLVHMPKHKFNLNKHMHVREQLFQNTWHWYFNNFKVIFLRAQTINPLQSLFHSYYCVKGIVLFWLLFRGLL